jgi:hypothetical protein
VSGPVERETLAGMRQAAVLKKAHSIALREKVRRCVLEGMRPCDIAERLGVSTTIIKEVRMELNRG